MLLSGTRGGGRQWLNKSYGLVWFRQTCKTRNEYVVLKNSSKMRLQACYNIQFTTKQHNFIVLNWPFRVWVDRECFCWILSSKKIPCLLLKCWWKYSMEMFCGFFFFSCFFLFFWGGCPKLLHVPTTKNKYMIHGHPLSKVSIYLRSRNRVWTWTFCPKYSLAFITIAEMQD